MQLLTLQQHIIVMRDERYHSPCRAETWAHRTFIASAKHNGIREWLPVEAAPLTQHWGGIRIQTIEGELRESAVKRTVHVH